MPNDAKWFHASQQDFAKFHITLVGHFCTTFLEFCIKLVRETELTILDGLFTCSMMTFVVDCRLKRNKIPCVSLLELKAFESQSQRNGFVVKLHIHTFGIPAFVDIVNKVNMNICVYIYICFSYKTRLNIYHRYSIQDTIICLNSAHALWIYVCTYT